MGFFFYPASCCYFLFHPAIQPHWTFSSRSHQAETTLLQLIAIFQLINSTGEDGFTVEFYKYFFDLVGADLLASLNRAYELGRLSVSQRRGIITLLPKDDAELLLLQNWRPITLLDMDYKIASKAIARQIEPMITKLVHPDQTGFIKGRYIGENVRLISDIMEQTWVNNTPGILINISWFYESFWLPGMVLYSKCSPKIQFWWQLKKMDRDFLHGHRKRSFEQRLCDRLI